MSGQESQVIKTKLLDVFTSRFAEQELITLCFHLEIDYSDLPAIGRENKARELVQYLNRRDRILECVEIGRKLRPDISWDELVILEDLLHIETFPVKDYDHFTGRNHELEQILNILNKTDRYRFVAIYGLGGIGKTALAQEIVRVALQRAYFSNVVWVSAKAEYFAGASVEKLVGIEPTFDYLLDEIAGQCGIPSIERQTLEEKQQSVQSFLAKHPILIVLDNLETVADYEMLVRQIGVLLRGQSKALLTSRHKVVHVDVFALNLSGLDEMAGIEFLQEESKSRGIITVSQAATSTLKEIHSITGGAPLAMKLVVGQLSRQPLDIVLQRLQTAAADDQDYEFYRFIFKQSWDSLSLEAKEVLVSLSVFEPAAGGSIEMVSQVSHMETGDFFAAMDMLINMSLVEFVGSLGHRRYILHQLTHYFVLSDIVKKWR